MNLPRAIEIGTLDLQNEYHGSIFELQDAKRILLEAGKLIKQHPTIRFFLAGGLLPRETEE